MNKAKRAHLREVVQKMATEAKAAWENRQALVAAAEAGLNKLRSKQERDEVKKRITESLSKLTPKTKSQARNQRT